MRYFPISLAAAFLAGAFTMSAITRLIAGDHDFAAQTMAIVLVFILVLLIDLSRTRR